MITGLLAFLGAVLVALMTKEMTAWVWHLSLWVAERAAARMPAALIDEYEEIYLGELETLQDRPLSAMVVSLRMLLGSRETAKIHGWVDPHPPALAMKRGIDAALAAFLMVANAPVLLLITIAIAVTMGTPVLFRQERLGKGGSRFELLKFRTIPSPLDQESSRTIDTVASTGFATSSRLGRLLRSFSLDELPQFWNVLRGDMSLVGPRPLSPYEIEHDTKAHKRRLEARPGITGLWQVSRRNQFSIDDMVRLDEEYVGNWSLGLDLRLMLRTVPAAFRGRQGVAGPSILARLKSRPAHRALVAAGIALAGLLALGAILLS